MTLTEMRTEGLRIARLDNVALVVEHIATAMPPAGSSYADGYETWWAQNAEIVRRGSGRVYDDAWRAGVRLTIGSR